MLSPSRQQEENGGGSPEYLIHTWEFGAEKESG